MDIHSVGYDAARQAETEEPDCEYVRQWYVQRV